MPTTLEATAGVEVSNRQNVADAGRVVVLLMSNKQAAAEVHFEDGQLAPEESAVDQAPAGEEARILDPRARCQPPAD